MTEMSVLETELLRGLSPQRKLDVMHALIRQAYELKEAWVRSRDPELSDAEVRERVREQVAGGVP